MVRVAFDEELMNAALGWAHLQCLNSTANVDEPACRLTMSYNSVGQNTAFYNDADVVQHNSRALAELVMKAW